MPYNLFLFQNYLIKYNSCFELSNNLAYMEGNMSCSMWMTVQVNSQSELYLVTELMKADRDRRIILSYGPPEFGGKKETAEEKIAGVLTELGIRPNLKGSQYLRTAVGLCLEDKEELDGITKRLYPSVAKQHRTTADKVEHAVKRAIEGSWIKGDTGQQKRVFGYDARDGKRPTNLEFISQVTDYVENRSSLLYS